MDRDPIAEAAWHLDAGHPAEALQALRDADELDPSAIALRARALTAVGRIADAEEEARRGLELEPENLALLEALAWAQLEHDPVAAEKTVLQGLALDAENERLLALNVLVLVRRQRFEKAERVLSRLMSIAPDAENTRRVRAVFLADAYRSERDAGVAAAGELLQERPDDAYAHYLQGITLLHKKWWVALRHLREAARLQPHDPRLAETARVMGSWYARPVLVTTGFVDGFIQLTAMLVMFILLTRDDPRWWMPFAVSWSIAIFRGIGSRLLQAHVQRRVTRTTREMYG
ncbi:MAG TPA: hypothetical protein VF266_01460 [Thermoanaerobaculia bacterium]